MRAPVLPPPIEPNRRRKKRRKSLLLSLLGFTFALGVVAFLGVSAVAGYLLHRASRDLPSYESLAKYEPPVMTRIHAHDGQLIAEYARERRIFVPINSIPKQVLDAFLSAEDKRFYEHGGLDFIGIARAGTKFIQSQIKRDNRRTEGASTITQQVAKNFLLTSDRTIERKLKEAILAIRIEKAYPKEKILELYLNEIYLGIGSYGVAAASLMYFNKELKDLAPEEAAYLAALPKAPNNYHPLREKTKEAGRFRRNWILDEMAANGFLPKAEAEAAKAKPLQVNLRPLGSHIFAGEFFAEEVRRALLAQYGEDKLYGGGMSVRTTLDPKMQRYARKALIDGLVAFDRERGWRGAVSKFGISVDWGAAIAAAEVGADTDQWRVGVVIEVQQDAFVVGLRPAKRPDGSIAPDRLTVTIPFDAAMVARKGGDRAKSEPAKTAGDIIRIGDVVWVGPKSAAQPRGAWTVRLPAEGGWTPVTNIAVEWGGVLARIDVPTDIFPWRLAVVFDVQKTKVTVGFRPPRNPDGSISAARDGAEIMFDEMKWAGKFVGSDKPKGTAPKQPSDIVSVGDVVYVAPKDPANLAGAWTLVQIPEVGGGLVAMDPHTGRVLAIAGGFSYSMSQFDRAVQAKRQPGSSFKPLVYAAAIDNGYKPTSIVLDAPIEIDQGPGKDVWKPENYNKDKSYGPSTLRVGIEKSRNQMTVRLAQDIGMPLIVEYSKRFGVYDDLLPVLAMSLGSGETTLLRMATAYSSFANGGRQVRATLIDRIQDRWGKTIWRHDERQCMQCRSETWKGQTEPEVPDDRKPIMDPHTAYQMTALLEGAVSRGTGTVIKQIVPGVPLAGKTGTTNDSKDTWFVGYSPDLVVGVFIGYDTPKPMGKSATGGHVSAPIFGNFMKMALADRKAVPFRQPPGLKSVRVNARTGLRAGVGEADAIWEFFKPGEEPDDPNQFLGYEAANVETSSGASQPQGAQGAGAPPRTFSQGRSPLY